MTANNTAPAAREIVARIVARFGAGRVRLIQRLSDGVYRAEMYDGTIAGAFVRDDGAIVVREMGAL